MIFCGCHLIHSPGRHLGMGRMWFVDEKLICVQYSCGLHSYQNKMLYLANELGFKKKKFLCAKVIPISHFKTNPNILEPKRSIQSALCQTLEC